MIYTRGYLCNSLAGLAGAYESKRGVKRGHDDAKDEDEGIKSLKKLKLEETQTEAGFGDSFADMLRPKNTDDVVTTGFESSAAEWDQARDSRETIGRSHLIDEMFGENWVRPEIDSPKQQPYMGQIAKSILPRMLMMIYRITGIWNRSGKGIERFWNAADVAARTQLVQKAWNECHMNPCPCGKQGDLPTDRRGNLLQVWEHGTDCEDEVIPLGDILNVQDLIKDDHLLTLLQSRCLGNLSDKRYMDLDAMRLTRILEGDSQPPPFVLKPLFHGENTLSSLWRPMTEWTQFKEPYPEVLPIIAFTHAGVRDVFAVWQHLFNFLETLVVIIARDELNVDFSLGDLGYLDSPRQLDLAGIDHKKASKWKKGELDKHLELSLYMDPATNLESVRCVIDATARELQDAAWQLRDNPETFATTVAGLHEHYSRSEAHDATTLQSIRTFLGPEAQRSRRVAIVDAVVMPLMWSSVFRSIADALGELKLPVLDFQGDFDQPLPQETAELLTRIVIAVMTARAEMEREVLQFALDDAYIASRIDVVRDTGNDGRTFTILVKPGTEPAQTQDAPGQGDRHEEDDKPSQTQNAPGPGDRHEEDDKKKKKKKKKKTTKKKEKKPTCDPVRLLQLLFQRDVSNLLGPRRRAELIQEFSGNRLKPAMPERLANALNKLAVLNAVEHQLLLCQPWIMVANFTRTTGPVDVVDIMERAAHVIPALLKDDRLDQPSLAEENKIKYERMGWTTRSWSPTRIRSMQRREQEHEDFWALVDDVLEENLGDSLLEIFDGNFTDSKRYKVFRTQNSGEMDEQARTEEEQLTDEESEKLTAAYKAAENLVTEMTDIEMELEAEEMREEEAAMEEVLMKEAEMEEALMKEAAMKEAATKVATKVDKQKEAALKKQRKAEARASRGSGESASGRNISILSPKKEKVKTRGVPSPVKAAFGAGEEDPFGRDPLGAVAEEEEGFDSGKKIRLKGRHLRSMQALFWRNSSAHGPNPGLIALKDFEAAATQIGFEFDHGAEGSRISIKGVGRQAQGLRPMTIHLSHGSGKGAAKGKMSKEGMDNLRKDLNANYGWTFDTFEEAP